MEQRPIRGPQEIISTIVLFGLGAAFLIVVYVAILKPIACGVTAGC